MLRRHDRCRATCRTPPPSPRRRSAGPIRDRRRRAADPPGDDLRARPRQPIPPRPQLRPRRQSRLRPAAGADDRARRRRRLAVVRLGDGGGDGGFPRLPLGAHVVAPRVMYWALRRWLAAAEATGALAVDFVDTTALDALRARGAAWPHPARVGRDAGQPAVVDHRHRRRRRDRPSRRRAAGGRQHRGDPGADAAAWRSAPTSSCIRRRNISTATAM